jgi:hypothetical protein
MWLCVIRVLNVNAGIGKTTRKCAEGLQSNLHYRILLGSAMNTDKFIGWYTAHRETVYWAIYHGKLEADIGTFPTDSSDHRTRYKNTPRKHIETSSLLRAARTLPRSLHQSRFSIRFFRNVDYNPGTNVGPRIVQSEQPTCRNFRQRHCV